MTSELFHFFINTKAGLSHFTLFRPSKWENDLCEALTYKVREKTDTDQGNSTDESIGQIGVLIL